MPTPRDHLPAEKYTRYQITVSGIVDDSWSEWFSGMEILSSRQESGVHMTILRGQVADQAALRGILNRLWDLNATLVALEPIILPGEDTLSTNQPFSSQERPGARLPRTRDEK